MGITALQERRTDNALDALRDLSSPRALVLRGGQAVRIPGREVVREDVLLLAEGDRVPADGVLLQAHELATDESMLTGESEAVPKQAGRVGSSPARWSSAVRAWSGWTPWAGDRAGAHRRVAADHRCLRPRRCATRWPGSHVGWWSSR